MTRQRLFWLTFSITVGFSLLVVTGAALQGAATAATTVPLTVNADPGDVVINEVSWAGHLGLTGDEWLELYNNTAMPILLDGWRLTTNDGTPDTILSGTIPARGYFLLERTDDATISDIPADQIYFGVLGNGGEIITLTDNLGNLIDTANGDGGDWPAGTASPNYYTMERIDPTAPDRDANWASNDGITRNGLDATGNPVNGTPKARNSVYAGPSADLSVTKSGPVTATLAGTITYTIRLSNTGQLTATAVRLTDTLPSALTFLAQASPFTFSRDQGQLRWDIGDLPTHTPPLYITVTGRVSTTHLGTIRNAVTATTAAAETGTANNHAIWDTAIVSVTGPRPRIAALLYDGYQDNDRDEALQLINVGDAPADLGGWKICDAGSGGSCATILSGTLGVHESAWLAFWASDFYTSSGFYPAYAVRGLAPGVSALSGAWPGYANAGDEAVLRDADDEVIDTLVYEGGDTLTQGWSGAAVEPWGSFGAEGQILYRTLDEATGWPVPDTDTAADWAQYAGDPAYGRRVRYPGWDLETFFWPLNATEPAHVTVGVAPDNAADVVLSAIAPAQSQIEIAVYTLRHPTLIQRLIEKAQAGVNVTLLLEGAPAGLSRTDPRWYQEMWACQELDRTGNGACWFMIRDASARIYDRYSYMHAKYVLIDRKQVLIGSQNLTESGMPDDDRANGTCGSRGVVLLTDAPSVVARVAQVFEHDLDPAHHVDLRPWSSSSSDYGPPPPDFTPVMSVTDYTTYTVVFNDPLTLDGTFDFELFTAPEASLRQSDALLGLLARAGAGDQVYVEGLDERAHWGADPADDPSLRMEAYIAAARRGARVRILLNGGWFGGEYADTENNDAAVAYANGVARQEGLDLQAATGDPTRFGIHNKMVLVWLDGEGGYAHIGSLNGSETSNKVNREVALQIQSDALFDYLKAVFDWDWNVSHPLYLPLVWHNWTAPGPPAGYPVISEVLYNPSGASDSGEWVEIFNPTARAVDLSGWYLGDVGPAGEFGSGLYTFPAGTTLPAGGVILIARQAEDMIGFTPSFELLMDPGRDDPQVPNMAPAGSWAGFGFALGNAGDEVLLLDATATPIDALVYGAGSYPGVIPHPGVSAAGRSLERRPAIYDNDDCSQDFTERNPPDPGHVSRE